MSLHDEKVAALAGVLTATGEEIVWKGQTLHALVSDNPLSQDKCSTGPLAGAQADFLLRRALKRGGWK